MSEEFESKNEQGFVSEENAQATPNVAGTGAEERTTYSWVNPKVNPTASNTESDMAKHAAENVGTGYTDPKASGYSSQAFTNDGTAYSNQTAGSTGTDYNSSAAGTGYNNSTSGYQNTYADMNNNAAGDTNTHNYTAYQFGSQNTGDQASGNQGGAGHSFHDRYPQYKASKGDKAPKAPRTRQPMTTGKRWAANVAMALVFGLVAGSVTYGVNYAGNKLNGDGSAAPVVQSTTVAGNDTSAAVTTASTDSSKYTVAEVAANAMPSLVAISTETVSTVQSFFGTYSQTVPASGTGVIVGQNDEELLIATNNHVIEGANSVSVAFTDETTVSAEIKGSDAANDLAVVAVKISDIPEDTMNQIKVATLGNSDDLVIGEEVVAIGNALGYGQSVTNGIVSAVDRQVQTQSETTGAVTTSDGLIQTNAAINPGNSGGALLNMKGELIGINEAKYSSTSVEGVGFAIPLAKAEPILENLMSMKTRSQVSDDDASYLGITGVNVSADMNSSYGVPVGVYVESLEEGGPAEEAGFQSKDVITKLDTRDVTTMTELQNALKYYAKGETVDVVVQRMENGEYEEKTLTVTLGARSDMKQTTSEQDQSQNGTTQDPQTVNPFAN